jgi:hypothetical protein
MTQTFTPGTDFTAKQTEKEPDKAFLKLAEPSESTIQNILNFSKNLEVKQSKWIDTIELLKS